MQKEIKHKIYEKTTTHNSGITLVALVVTIVVLLILAGVTITMLFGENGIIKKAQEAKEATERDQQETQQGLQDLNDQMSAILNGNGGSGTGSGETGNNKPDEPEVPKGPNGKPLVTSVTTTEHTDKIVAEDSLGNIVVIPAGFKVVEGTEGEEITVQNGVVIEDSAGNQFVWIPIGVVTKNDRTKSNDIVLGRYTFARTENAETGLYEDGTPTLKQAAYTDENPTNYETPVTIDTNCQELSTARDGLVDTSDHLNDLNATAKDLAGFVDSVKTNGGYYLARYEASYGSGYNSEGTTNAEKYGSAKPLSQPSTAKGNSMSYTAGTLWNNITQLNAAKVARNMYANNLDVNGNSVGVESDLVNSYAWDTAIVYIQEMGHTNYANANRDTTGNTSLMNTGETGDVVCNIYDMAANTYEWTTEYSTDTDSTYAYPCVGRGGGYNTSDNYTASRLSGAAATSYDVISFRSTLYVK